MMYIDKTTRLATIAQAMVILFISGFIMHWGRTIFIPLSFAILISFILLPFCQWTEKKGMPRTLSILAGMFLLLFFLASIVVLLAGQLKQFSSEWPLLKFKLITTWSDLQALIQDRTGITRDEQTKWLKETVSGNPAKIFSFFQSFVYGSVVNIVLLILIPILSVLLLYSRERWLNALILIFKSTEPDTIKRIMHDTIHAYFNFIKGMGIVYLTVGLLNSLGLLALGIPHPFLFGFIASILTFIPYVGIMVASLLPITISWMEYNSIWYPIGVIALFTFVQYLEANIIFPLAVSSRLDINPFMTIIAILIGGLLWGASGMILFVPFAAIVKLIADRSEKLSTISVLLGSD